MSYVGCLSSVELCGTIVFCLCRSGEYYFPFAVRLPGGIPFTFDVGDSALRIVGGCAARTGVVFCVGASATVPGKGEVQDEAVVHVQSRVLVSPAPIGAHTSQSRLLVSCCWNREVTCTLRVDKTEILATKDVLEGVVEVDNGTGCGIDVDVCIQQVSTLRSAHGFRETTQPLWFGP